MCFFSSKLLSQSSVLYINPRTSVTCVSGSPEKECMIQENISNNAHRCTEDGTETAPLTHKIIQVRFQALNNAKPTKQSSQTAV